MDRAMELDSEDDYEYEYHDTETEVSCGYWLAL